MLGLSISWRATGVGRLTFPGVQRPADTAALGREVEESDFRHDALQFEAQAGLKKGSLSNFIN